MYETEQPAPVEPTDALALLMQFAEAEGDISPLLTSEAIAKLSQEVCDTYESDKQSREDWEKVAKKALEDMAKCEFGVKDTPWPNASNVRYPLLPYAVMQFNARAYPAIVKGDEAVSCKVVGSDNGMPVMMGGQPVMQFQGVPVIQTPQGPMATDGEQMMPVPPDAPLEPMWQRPPGAKAKRAERVRDFMNYMLFYRMGNWESETDTLLFQMPAIGLGFRKIWNDGEHNSRFVPALRLVVNNDAKSLDDAPQITEEIDGVYPHMIRRDMAVGKYRAIVLEPDEKEARLLLEAQCYYDLDGDGMDEPYIVTVDHKTKELLRVVPDFGPEQVKALPDGRIAYIERRKFYVKYEFLPHPDGKFYNIGLAHLLDQYSEVINTLINQMIDASTAAVSGGGFVASGLRIQGQGQASSLKWRPGEYKAVSASGQQLREGIVERTFPQVNAVQFQLLELILGAAKEIASIKDVLSGDASNMGQVGTTLAMIEQGLQVFTAIYKRVYRGLKDEFTLLFENIARYADEATAQAYMELLDDPTADFAKDFNGADMDIRPVSDPSSVTQMQRMARAQYLMGTVDVLQAVGGDPKEALRRAYEAANMEDIDKLLPEPGPEAKMGQQMQMDAAAAEIEATKAKAFKDYAQGQAAGTKLAFDFEKLGIERSAKNIEAMKAGMEALRNAA